MWTMHFEGIAAWSVRIKQTLVCRYVFKQPHKISNWQGIDIRVICFSFFSVVSVHDGAHQRYIRITTYLLTLQKSNWILFVRLCIYKLFTWVYMKLFSNWLCTGTHYMRILVWWMQLTNWIYSSGTLLLCNCVTCCIWPPNPLYCINPCHTTLWHYNNHNKLFCWHKVELPDVPDWQRVSSCSSLSRVLCEFGHTSYGKQLFHHNNYVSTYIFFILLAGFACNYLCIYCHSKVGMQQIYESPQVFEFYVISLAVAVYWYDMSQLVY